MDRPETSSRSEQEPASGAPAPPVRDLFYVALFFALVRAAAWALGVGLDYETVQTHWQFLDPAALERDLGGSLLNLHSQPPLLNLLYGALAKLAPADHGAGPAAALFFALGLASALAIFHLLGRLGAGRRTAAVLVALFVLDPAAVLFEHYFFYTHLVMALLCLAAAALERWTATARAGWLAAFFAAVTAVALARSAFHLVWLAAVAALVVALAPGRRRLAAGLAAAALAVAGAWYAKNAALFGHFTASTWMGMNLTRYVTNRYSDEEVAALVRSGTVSPLYWVSPFAPVETYERYVPLPSPTGVAVLDERRKSSGAPNYNHLVYVAVSDRYREDSARVIAADPAVLVAAQPDTWTLYFQPSSQYFRFIRTVFSPAGAHGANVAALGPLVRAFDAVVWLQPSPAPSDEALLGYHRPEALGDKLRSISWTSVAGSLVVFLLVPALARRRLREGARGEALVLLFMWLAVVWVAVVGNSFEVGENQRFKFETQALWVVLLGVAIGEGVRRLRARAVAGGTAAR